MSPFEDSRYKNLDSRRGQSRCLWPAQALLGAGLSTPELVCRLLERAPVSVRPAVRDLAGTRATAASYGLDAATGGQSRGPLRRVMGARRPLLNQVRQVLSLPG